MRKFVFALFLVIAVFGVVAEAQAGVFTYQGRLTDGLVAASGTYEMQFSLWNAAAGPAQVGTTVTNNAVVVTNGIFTVELNFTAPNAFDGGGRWLEIAVRKASDPPGFTILAPRQSLTSSPYSIRTVSASSADALSLLCNPCVTDGQIVGLSGSKVNGTVPNATNAATATTATTATTAGTVTGVVQIANGGTGSATQNFVDLSTTQNIGGSKTFTNGLSVTGSISISGGIDFSSRVLKTANMTGIVFANQTISGSNVCPVSYHPMTAWEAMVVDMLAPTQVFDQQGWVIGSFPNIDINLRSLANGQDSTVCPVGSYLTKYPSIFQHGAIVTRGGMHCAPAAASMPVWCIRNQGM
jgi:hypothetical protein